MAKSLEPSAVNSKQAEESYNSSTGANLEDNDTTADDDNDDGGGCDDEDDAYDNNDDENHVDANHAPKFGPSKDDPEYKMGPPDTFQSNLEAVMAVIMEKFNDDDDKEPSTHAADTHGDTAMAKDGSGITEDMERNGLSVPGPLASMSKETKGKIFKQPEKMPPPGDKDRESSSSPNRTIPISHPRVDLENENEKNGDKDGEKDNNVNSEAENIVGLSREIRHRGERGKTESDKEINKQVLDIVKKLVRSAVEIASSEQSSVEGSEGSDDDEDEEDHQDELGDGGNSSENSVYASWAEEETAEKQLEYGATATATTTVTAIESQKSQNNTANNHSSSSYVAIEDKNYTAKTSHYDDATQGSSSSLSSSSVKGSLGPPNCPVRPISISVSSREQKSPDKAFSCHQSTQTDSSTTGQMNESGLGCPKYSGLSPRSSETNAKVSDTVRVNAENQDDCDDSFGKDTHNGNDDEKKEMEETIANLHSKHKLKTLQLYKMEERFMLLCRNVHQLLSLTLPDVNLGDIMDTEEMVKGMIKSHEELMNSDLDDSMEEVKEEDEVNENEEVKEEETEIKEEAMEVNKEEDKATEEEEVKEDEVTAKEEDEDTTEKARKEEKSTEKEDGGKAMKEEETMEEEEVREEEDGKSTEGKEKNENKELREEAIEEKEARKNERTSDIKRASEQGEITEETIEEEESSQPSTLEM